MHELSHVRIGWATSTSCNDKHFMPRTFCFRQEISANGKQHRPCEICCGSPTLTVTFAHCSIDVSHILPTSAHLLSSVGSMHRSGKLYQGRSASVRWHQLWPTRIDKVISVVASALIPRDINQWKITTAKAYTYQSLRVCIDSTTRLWLACIG